jgi:hypothetical protein
VLTISTAVVSASDRPAIKLSNICIEITNDKNLQPTKEITLTINYRDADIEGLDEAKLSLARYDTEHNRWITIPSVIYASQNKIVGTVKHLSKFALVQLSPVSDLSAVKVFPNPFNPTNGILTIDNLTADADIKIFNVVGELIGSVSYTTANGRTTWDGKNDNGITIASGVYMALIKNSTGKKIIKIAVEK